MNGRHRHSTAGLILTAILVAAMVPTVASGAERKRRTLPPAVESAVRRAFPEAEIRSFGRERENGALYYEVNLRNDGQRLEVEVSPEGVIGEIEGRVHMVDLSEDMRERIIKATRGMKIRRIELHERRGRARGGTFVPIAKPTLKYEVKYFDGRRSRSLMLPVKADVALTKRAAGAIEEAFPDARVVKKTQQVQERVKLFEVELLQGRTPLTVLVSRKGLIVAVKRDLAVSELPPRIAEMVAPAAKDGQVRKVHLVEAYAGVKSRQLRKLRQVLTMYEVELDMGDTGAWFKITADGRVIDKWQWSKDYSGDYGDHGDDDDDNDNDNDEDDDEDEDEDEDEEDDD